MRWLFLLFCVLLCGCDKPENPEDYSRSDLTLPGGRVIKVDMMISQLDLGRGMKYRSSLAPDHGMLFVHATPGYYRYWMYQVLIPLDIIWMDTDRKIILIMPDAQPCKTTPDQCPQYGSPKPAHYVLELAGGMAKKYNLRVGQQVDW